MNGILLPIFSLPSKYGIGDFGYESYKLIDMLSESKIDVWQILPIFPIGCGNSPYSPKSFFAIEPLFISLDLLKEENLIKDIDIINFDERIDYDKVREYKYKYFEEAFKNAKNINYELSIATLQYAVFETNNKKNNISWNKWNNYNDKLSDASFEIFLQSLVLKQWKKLKDYANQKGVKIIGDLPIYPDYNSSDVYYNKNNFCLVKNEMKYVSGAAPDCFSNKGQKWGHPLYNIEYMIKDKYSYQLKKYNYIYNLFDYIRIDHFKAYESFFMIPFDSLPNDGHYEKGLSYPFLDILFNNLDSKRFIVEDLGDLNAETYKLRDKYNLTGMKIFQSTFNTKTFLLRQFKNQRCNCWRYL